jgi:hypothetical protein
MNQVWPSPAENAVTLRTPPRFLSPQETALLPSFALTERGRKPKLKPAASRMVPLFSEASAAALLCMPHQDR